MESLPHPSEAESDAASRAAALRNARLEFLTITNQLKTVASRTAASAAWHGRPASAGRFPRTGSSAFRPHAMADNMAGKGDDKNDDGRDPGTLVITRTKPATKRPNMYRVLILNDDYTPMEFVVHVLERFFQKSREEATRVMLHVHHHGVGECGVYTYEVAETKVTQVMDFARKHQHPLQCVMEKK